MLPKHTLPERPNLERLKRFARALQRAAKTNPGAQARIAVFFAQTDVSGVKLSQAQTVIAREHGFASWTALAEAVAAKAQVAPAAQRAAPVYPPAFELAATWFALAQAGDHHRLLRAMVVPRRLTLAAREIMLRDADRTSAFVDCLVAGLTHQTARVRALCAHALDTFGDARARRRWRR